MSESQNELCDLHDISFLKIFPSESLMSLVWSNACSQSFCWGKCLLTRESCILNVLLNIYIVKFTFHFWLRSIVVRGHVLYSGILRINASRNLYNWLNFARKVSKSIKGGKNKSKTVLKFKYAYNYFFGGGGRMLCSPGCLLSHSIKIIKFNKKIETNVISLYVQNVAFNFHFEI